MADFLDKSGEDYEEINSKIRQQNELLEQEISIFRELTNAAQEYSTTIKGDISTHRSILSLSLRLENIFRNHVNFIDEQVKGLRSINQILKDRNIIEDMVRTLNNESDLSLGRQKAVLEEIAKISSRIANEQAKNIFERNNQLLEKLIEEKGHLEAKSKAYLKISEIFKEQAFTQETLLENLENEEELVNNINKTLGVAPALLDGIDKTLRRNGFGRFAEQLNIGGALDRVKVKLASLNSSGKAFPGGFKTAGMLTKELTSSLGGVLTKTNLIAGAIALVVDGILKADKAQAELQRKLNLSRDDAREIRRDFGHIANHSNNIFITAKGIQEAFIDINESLNTSAIISGDLLENYTLITKQAGFTKEISLLLTKIGLTQNKNQKELLLLINKEIAAYKGRTGILLNERKIIEDINKISSGAAAVMGNQVEKLAKAVASAESLGTTIDKLEQSSRNLLEFESSISAELEAQLMTGKDINLNRARELALIGDLSGVAKELKNEVGSLLEFQRLNVFQQESLAKAIGLSRDEVAKMLLDQEAMLRLNVRQGETIQERWQFLVKERGLEEAKRIIGNKSLADQLQSVSNQEKLAAMGEKLLEIFIQLGDVLMPIFNLLADILNAIVPPLMKGVGVIFDIFKGIGDEIDNLFGTSIEWSKTWEVIGDIVAVSIVAPLQGLQALLDLIVRALKSIGNLTTSVFKFSTFDFSGGMKDLKEAGAVWNKNTALTIKKEDQIVEQISDKWSKARPEEFKKQPSPYDNIHPFAEGGIVTKPMVGLVGEEGPEAIIPLNKKLEPETKNTQSKIDINNINSIEELKELNKNIKTLINIVQRGKDINMDGYKVGTLIALESVKMQ